MCKLEYGVDKTKRYTYFKNIISIVISENFGPHKIRVVLRFPMEFNAIHFTFGFPKMYMLPG